MATNCTSVNSVSFLQVASITPEAIALLIKCAKALRFLNLAHTPACSTIVLQALLDYGQNVEKVDMTQAHPTLEEHIDWFRRNTKHIKLII